MFIKYRMEERDRGVKTILLIILILIMGLCGLVYCQEIRKDGIHKTYFADGQLRTEENFKDGKRNGISKIYNKKGQLIIVVQFKDNEFVSVRAVDPKRDLGKIGFLSRMEFWIGVFAGVSLLWFLWIKSAFKKRPF